MKAPNHEERPPQDVSWLILLIIGAVFVGCLCLLRYNVIYTEGEVMQSLFTLLVALVAACVLIGFHRRKIAMWCVTLLGGSLLLWQSYQTRKWVVIHEDIVAIVRFAEESKTKTGHYPTSLEGYVFKNSRVKTHICGLGSDVTNGFHITYFMNDPGITYWYSSKTGFGYYPD
jgi:drug/metabolite transporter (DMT)-like permease